MANPAQMQAGASLLQALPAFLPSSGTQKQSGTTTTTQELDISEEAIMGIIQKVLGSEQGLASIFNEEQLTGLYNTTSAKQAAGDLTTKLASEIAQLQAKQKTTAVTDARTSTKDRGAIGSTVSALGIGSLNPFSGLGSIF